MPLRLVTPPAVEPVTLAEVRAHLRLGEAPNYAVGPDSQTVALPALGGYTLEVTGTGSVAIAAGTAVGTGWGSATAGSPVAVHLTAAGTVTLTVTEAPEVPADPGADPPVEGSPAEEITALSLTPAQADDAQLAALVTAAREMAEAITRRALLTQTWDLFLDEFPAAEIEVPLPRLQSVTSITYTDAAGVSQTLAAGAYQVDTASEPARLLPAYGTSWPCTRAVPNAVAVRYVAGYGDTPADVPQPIRQAVLLLVSGLYEAAVPEEALKNSTVHALLAPHRVLRF